MEPYLMKHFWNPSAIEHPAVKQSCAYLWEKGFSVTYLPVDEYGTVSIDALRAAISDNTILISVMYANNEVGTIQPVREIAEIAKEYKILFHTDAVQAFGSVKIDFNQSPIDLLSLSAHKFYGPKGAGALIVRNGLLIHPLLHGGTQEHRQRAGTEHLAGIDGIFVSAGSACHCRSNTSSHVLAAMDIPEEYQKSAVRFSFGEDNQESDIDPVVTALQNEVDDIRSETLRYAI
jgi:cysteine sulfinate desulfinase/cysteine desulfurase-like protein